MSAENIIPIASLIVTALSSLILIYLAWGYRKEKEAYFFILLLLGVFVWSLSYMLELLFSDKELMVTFAKITYVGIVIIPVAWFSFCSTYTGKFNKIMKTRLFYFLMIIPVITLFLVFTNELHFLHWAKIRISQIGSYTTITPIYGPWFWIHALYSYILLLVGSAVMIDDAIRSPTIYKKRSITIIAAAVTPWVGNIAYVFRVTLLDITPISFVVSMTLLLMAVYKYKLMEIIPVARDIIIENMEDAIFVLDKRNKIVDMNPSAERLVGFTRNKAIGMNGIKIFNEWPEIVRLYNSEKRVRKVVKKGNKNAQFYNAEFIPITEKSNIIGKLVVIHDITKLKRAEEYAKEEERKLRVLNEKLEEKVKERTREIERLLKQKDEFINQLGHDLKTPLTPILSLLPIIQEKEKNPELKRLIDIVLRNSRYIKNLVIDTLNLARLNTPNIEFKLEEIPLQEVVREVLENNEYLIRRKNISVENLISDKIMVKADRKNIKEVFTNLLSNSIKFTPHNGKIVFRAEPVGKEVKVYVKDTGIGLKEEDKERIFDEFYKADKSRHNVDSSGLGLTICKRIVEKHGGKIWAESEGIGKGTTMYFTLPSAETEKK